MHNHSHDHAHTHAAPDLQSKNVRNAYYIGIALNLGYVVVEAIAGLWQNSLALLSEAGHNFSDVISLALSLVAFRLASSKANKNFSYGYKKSTVLAALINALILFAAIGAIIYEAVLRFNKPQPVEGGVVAVIAFVGIFVNGFSAWLFMKDKEKDLNVKGAYLHMLSDAAVSLGVVIAGVIIIFTKWYWLDSVISIIIGIIILYGTWGLFRQSARLSLDGMPEGISFDEIKAEVLKIGGVLDFRHVHIWALSTTENAMTAHVKLSQNMSVTQAEKVLQEIHHVLQHHNIQHPTVEIYTGENTFAEGESL